MAAQQLQPREVKIRVHDGVEIAVALYMPEGNGPFPVLFAPSPYRYDNNTLPASPQFLWRETGPIEMYVARGYVYANMDVRGCGKSGGTFRLLDRNEQKDLYDVIEWLGHQPWSSGKVGGIGQSVLLHVAMVDGDPEAAVAEMYRGVRRHERSRTAPRSIRAACSATLRQLLVEPGPHHQSPSRATASIRASRSATHLLIQQHPTLRRLLARALCRRAIVRDRDAALFGRRLGQGRPAHRGNINGFRRASGPKKLKMIGPINAFVANKESASPEMHERVLLPFYDHYPKGQQTDYAKPAPGGRVSCGAPTNFRTPRPGRRRAPPRHLEFERPEIRQRQLAQRRQPHGAISAIAG